MEWLSYSKDSSLRNIRSMTEFEFCWLSENLVENYSVDLDSSKCKKSVTLIKVF